MLTDAWGRYALPVDDDEIVFVIKPGGWMTPIDENNIPKFYYIHKPEGSPSLRYPGVQPTGPIPDSVDFALHRRHEKKRFRMVLFGDPQPYTEEEVFFLGHDVIEELVGVKAACGVSLGDLVGNDLALFPLLNDVVVHVGVPWYNVLGNHDINFDAPSDKLSDESFERVYGPACYSFDYGSVHFIILDDVVYEGSSDDEKPHYRGGFGEKQLAFIRNDLAVTPCRQLVVLMMHIPLQSVDDRHELFEILADHSHTLSLAAHHHLQSNEFFGPDDGWKQ